MLEKWDKNNMKKIIWSGNSAGALFALAIVLEIPIDLMEQMYNRMLKYARKYGIFGKMSIYHDIIIDEVFETQKFKDAYKECNNRLYIGVTCFPCKYKLISHWNSNLELRNTLHQSMHFPFWSNNISITQNRIVLI